MPTKVRIPIFTVFLWVALSVAHSLAQSADSLPAFKADSAVQEPFRKVEAGPSPWSANPTPETPTSRSDSVARSDTVTDKLRRRGPAVSLYLGVDFIDFDAKGFFKKELDGRKTPDALTIKQEYESVHLAFPIGFQGVIPVHTYFDVVAKTHSYWYKQSAILVDKAGRAQGDEFFAVQSNLGGLGMRYYFPPTLLSIKGGLGIYVQGLLYWNLGNSEIYTPFGAAEAVFEARGSAYEIQFGMHHDLTGSWRIAGAIGYLQQDFKSRSDWTEILKYSAPAGKASWGGSAIQATLGLWYHFGVPSKTEDTKSPNPTPGPVSN